MNGRGCFVPGQSQRKIFIRVFAVIAMAVMCGWVPGSTISITSIIRPHNLKGPAAECFDSATGLFSVSTKLPCSNKIFDFARNCGTNLKQIRYWHLFFRQRPVCRINWRIISICFMQSIKLPSEVNRNE